MNNLRVIFFFDEWKNACGQTAFYIGQNDCQNVSPSIIQAITKCHCDDFRRPSKLNAPATSDKINEYYLRVLPTRFSSRRQFDLFNISHTIRAVAPRNVLLLLHFRFYISKFRANTFANQLTRLWHSANRQETYMWNSMFERMYTADDSARFIAKETLLTNRRSSSTLSFIIITIDPWRVVARNKFIEKRVAAALSVRVTCRTYVYKCLESWYR